MRPFANGMQYRAWQHRNCERCTKFNLEDIKKSCPLDYAVASACSCNGEITDEIAARIGTKKGEDRYTWICKELEIR